MKAHGKNATIRNTKRSPAPSEGHAGRIKRDTQKINVKQLWDCVSKGERVKCTRIYEHS